MKKVIAADAKNGVSEFVIPEDMKSDNPLLGKKITPDTIDNSNLSPSQAKVDKLDLSRAKTTHNK